MLFTDVVNDDSANDLSTDDIGCFDNQRLDFGKVEGNVDVEDSFVPFNTATVEC